MAKDKTRAGVPNKHLHARISYLQQAATYLASQTTQEPSSSSNSNGSDSLSRQMWRQQELANTVSSEMAEITVLRDKPESESRQVLNFRQPSFGGLPLHLSSHLVQVARKSQIRLHPSIKHALCKRCSTPLIEGQTCTKTMENLSDGGRKPHADVLVLECKACGATKRWPVGAKRQERKTRRKHSVQKTNDIPSAVKDTSEVG